jgi:hypothetical protein
MASAPPPGGSERIQSQPSGAAAGTGEHRYPPEHGRHTLAEGLSTSDVPSDKGNREASLGVHNDHRWIPVLVLKQGGYQPGHQTSGTHHHETSAAGPLLGKGGAGVRHRAAASHSLNHPSLLEPGQNALGNGAETQTPARLNRYREGRGHGPETGGGEGSASS